jgi:hypothetical protein
MIYAVDLVKIMANVSGNTAARTIRNLKEDIFPSCKFTERQISNQGGYNTKLISFENALELVMVIPGAFTKKTRTNFKKIIMHYMKKDKTSTSETCINGTTISPIAQLDRESIDSSTTGRINTGIKRRYEDPSDSDDLSKSMEFINKAFDYQQQALKMRHDQEEYETLKHEDEESSEYIRQLELKLKTSETEQSDKIFRIAEQIQIIWVLSGLCQEQGPDFRLLDTIPTNI